MASDLNDAEIAGLVERVVSTLRTQGDSHLDALTFKGLEYSACAWHPSMQDHQKLSQLLIKYIDSKPFVWGYQ